MGAAQIRVVLQHSPTLYEIVGLFDAETTKPTLTYGDEKRTYYHTQSTDRWQLYVAAVTGHGAAAFDPRQQ